MCMFAAYMCVYMGTLKQACVYASVCVYMSLVYLYIYVKVIVMMLSMLCGEFASNISPCNLYFWYAVLFNMLLWMSQ